MREKYQLEKEYSVCQESQNERKYWREEISEDRTKDTFPKLKNLWVSNKRAHWVTTEINN